MGCGCGGNSSPPPAPPPAMAGRSEALAAQRTSTINNRSKENSMVNEDKNFVMIEYTHRSRGKHQVTGRATNTRYGYRKQGDKFIVHVSDVAAQPQLFRVVAPPSAPSNEAKVVYETQSVPTPPPPPKALETTVDEETGKATISLTIDEPVIEVEIADDEEVDGERERIINAAKTSPFIELGAVPGVTPSVEKEMKSMGLVTIESIIEAGVEGLKEVKGIAQTRAEAIYDYVVNNYGPDGVQEEVDYDEDEEEEDES